MGDCERDDTTGPTWAAVVVTATVDLTTAQGVWVATTGTGTRYAIAARELLVHRAPADGAPTAPWDHVWIPWDSLEILDGTDPTELAVGTHILYWFRYIGGPRWQRSSPIVSVREATSDDLVALPPLP